VKQLPYYPYYPRDFSESEAVLAMNLAEVGLYQLCLNYAWEHGHIPADPGELARRIRQDPKVVKAAWKKVAPCWVPNGAPGYLVNPRMEEERQNVKQIVAARSKGAATTNAKRWGERIAQRSVSDSLSEVSAIRSDVSDGLTELSLRAFESVSESGFESEKEKVELYRNFDLLMAKWPENNRRGVDLGAQVWISLVDHGEITASNLDEIFQGLRGHKTSEQWQEKGGKFIPAVSTWLQKRAWKDKLKQAEKDSWAS
jgi:uncharacterized protein YdaU (DUF1376 family)